MGSMYNEGLGGAGLEFQTLAQTERRDTETPFDGALSKGDRSRDSADWTRLATDLTSEARLQDEANERLSNELVGRLIQDYERIIQSGLPPAQAIASVIGWASGECRRLRS
jgi:hypothetical protein